jgi:hypothetical protein
MSKKKFRPHSYYGNRSYFKATDFPKPRILVTEMFREETTQYSPLNRWGKQKPKLVAYFVGEEMGIVMSGPNCKVMEELTGSPYADDWVGVQIEVFNDLSVRNPRTGEYGAIRFRRPMSQPAPTAPHPPVPLSQPTSKSMDEVNGELAAASDDEMPY